jgi:transcriptional regulator with XRE-family HTH domain
LVRVRIHSEAIWAIIARRNISQNELATELGISSGYMSQLLCGKRSPSPQLRRRILTHLEPITFDELFIIENGIDSD